MDSCIYSELAPVVCAYIDTLSIFFLNGSCALHWRQKKYFNSPDITYRNRYIREYNLLKQENPSLTVEAFAESIKVFLAAQEKQRTQQEKWGAEQERAELKQKYDL